MSATDELRRLLDERGVPYETNDDMGASETRWNGFTAYQLTPNAKLVMHPTPEQAIAATLGGGVKDCENLLWEFIGALDVADTTDADKKPIVSDYARHIAATLGTEINGDTSDGYHTFDELYYHRTALFACLVALQPRQMAFKSWKHSDGTMYEGFFIAGIYTSGGWCTYHCEAKWWPLFDCHEQEFAPEWDGHTPSDAIHRLMSDFLPSQDVSGEASE